MIAPKDPAAETLAQPQPSSSAWSPFRHATFAMLWIATVVSNIGSWMYSAASGWLMTDLSPSPLIVSLVQVATTLPIFLFAFPVGALADIVDRRKFLILAQVLMTVVSTAFAAIVWLGAATPANLLLFTFLIGIGGAMTSPAFQAIVPQLVPKADLNSAVAANSVGMNVSRAIGPALAGVLVAAIGISSPFWLNALSNLGVITALMAWRQSQRRTETQPVERFSGAIRVGLRHARNNPHLRATLVRASAFFLFASAYWALLPLVARSRSKAAPRSTATCSAPSALGGGCRAGAALAQDAAGTRSAGGRRHHRHGAGDGAVRPGAPPGAGAARQRARGRLVDRRAGEPQRLGPGGPARLGAGARACRVRNGVLRVADAGQPDLGPGGDPRGAYAGASAWLPQAPLPRSR